MIFGLSHSVEPDGLKMDQLLKVAIEMWPNIVTIIKYWQTQCKSKQPHNNKYFDTLVHHHTSSLIRSKVALFQIHCFLQSLLAIEKVTRQIMTLFVRRDVLEKAVTPFMLNKLDVSNMALWNICKIIFSLSHGQAAVE